MSILDVWYCIPFGWGRIDPALRYRALWIVAGRCIIACDMFYIHELGANIIFPLGVCVALSKRPLLDF